MKSNQNYCDDSVVSTQMPIALLEKLIVGSGVLLFIGIAAFMILFAAMYVIQQIKRRVFMKKETIYIIGAIISAGVLVSMLICLFTEKRTHKIEGVELI